jgi:hypothetical protein
MNVMTTSAKMALMVTREKVPCIIHPVPFVTNPLAVIDSPPPVHDDLDTAE